MSPGDSGGWRRGAGAVVVLSFDVDAESAILARGSRYARHASVMTHQAFGPLVGVPRILALLAEHRITASFFVPGLTADRYPHVIEAIASAGHEIAHHSYSHRAPVGLSLDEERADFEQGLSALQRLGITPRGHRAAGWEASWHTPALAAEHGLQYDSSLMDADRPYRLATAAGTVIELPVHWSLDDWEQYAYLPDPPIGQLIRPAADVAAMWSAELDAMRRHGCLFMLTCHPFLSGRASRIEGLRTLLEHAIALPDVRFATAAEVAAEAQADPSLEQRQLRPVEIDDGIYPD